MTEQPQDDERAIAADSDATSAETGSGDGGDLGTPSKDPDEGPPSEPQERNAAVSGGGIADTTAADDEDEDQEGPT